MEFYKSSDQGTRVRRDRYKLCSNCSNFSHFTETQEYCVVCGTKFISECQRCREPILYPTATYCPACGGRLVKTAAVKS